MVEISTSLPLKEKDDVRAATCRSFRRDSESSSSSLMPSEKYSCSLSPLMFTKGSTAIEYGGGVNVGAVVSTLDAVPEEAEGAAMCFEIQNLSKTKYASARITTVPITATAKFAPRAAQPIRLIAGAAADSPLAGARMAIDVSGDSRRCTRSTKAGGVSPPGRRVH